MTETDRYRALLAPLRAPGRAAGLVPEYPPATEEHLRVTEKRLGFALPPALRMLYAEIANGGDVFRDGYVVYGAVGGFPHPQAYQRIQTWQEVVATIDQLVSRSGWRLNERVDAALRRHLGAFVQCEERPDGFVSIADLGCSQTVELDGWTGRLYVAGCGQDLHSYRAAQGVRPPPGSEDDYLVVLYSFAASVEEWITRRLNGAWMADVPSMPACELTPEMLDEVGT